MEPKPKALMIILAHRGNIGGPNQKKENSESLITQAIQNGYGLELDIRKDANDVFYLSHDICHDSVNQAAIILQKIKEKAPQTRIALNIKELGYEKKLLSFLQKFSFPNIFLFDFELLEEKIGQTAKALKAANSNISLALRVSDRNEPLSRATEDNLADYIWLDEFDSLWVEESHIQRLRSTQKKIIVISPELHGHSLKTAKKRWKNFIDWGVDGICTDYCTELRKMINKKG